MAAEQSKSKKQKIAAETAAETPPASETAAETAADIAAALAAGLAVDPAVDPAAGVAAAAPAAAPASAPAAASDAPVLFLLRTWARAPLYLLLIKGRLAPDLCWQCIFFLSLFLSLRSQ